MAESLRAARASSNLSVLILLDLSSTFDTVNHQILLSTLAKLVIADSALTWFTSYLTNRTFQVTWNGSLSKPCFLETVPHTPARALCSISWPAGTPIAESKQSPLSKVTTLLCFGTSVVEWTSDQSQDSRITPHVLQNTQDSFVQTSSYPKLGWILPAAAYGYIFCLSAVWRGLQLHFNVQSSILKWQ